MEPTKLQHKEKRQQDGAENAKNDLEEESVRVYRKLCWILVAMTLTLFTINILQVFTLQYFDRPSNHPGYFIVFPAVVFAIFLTWLLLHVLRHPEIFVAEPKKIPHWMLFFSPHRDDRQFFKERPASSPTQSEQANPLTHNESDDDHNSQVTFKPRPWPKSLAKLGVIVTVLCNITIVEFIYLNTSAIPEYEQIIWQTTYPTLPNISAPSVAIVEVSRNDRSAQLVKDPELLDQLCRRFKYTEAYPDQRCFRNYSTFKPAPILEPNLTNSYVIFDAKNESLLGLSQELGIFYAYTYDGARTFQEPTLEISLLSEDLVPDFANAYRCGLISRNEVLAKNRNRISLVPYFINDAYNRMQRSDTPEVPCNTPNFQHYSGYTLSLLPLAAEPPSLYNNNNCDTSDKKYNGVCYAHVLLSFSNLLATNYTSKRGTDASAILEKEGGVIGYVTFFTWFFDIFAK